MKGSGKQIKIKTLVFIWIMVLAIIALFVLVAELKQGTLKSTSYSIISMIIAFASFIATSFFSISIYNHNATIREMNNINYHNNTSTNRRAEAFRNLQFISSNYTIIEFIDFMILHEEYKNYSSKLLATHNFQFYLLENGINKEDVIENFSNYKFLTTRIPLKIVEGKAINKITFLRFKFEKNNSSHIFFPADACNPTSSLIIYNETDSRNEALVNLIIQKDSDFFISGELNPFTKIKIDLNMESLLGVIVHGKIELYFTNPEKIEKSGANKYKINSSQFELTDFPKLKISKEFDPD